MNLIFTGVFTDAFTDVFSDAGSGALTTAFTDGFTGAFTDVFTDDLSDVFQKLRKLRIQGRMQSFEKVCQRREREQVLQNPLKHVGLDYVSWLCIMTMYHGYVLVDALKDFLFFKAMSHRGRVVS